jgi:hypothetical protein
MGEVSSVSLAYKLQEPDNEHHLHKHHKTDKKTCCKAINNDHKSCCDNNLVKLQDNSDGKVIVKSLQLDLGAYCAVNEWIPVRFFEHVPQHAQQQASFYCEANAPPLFKLYCQYIFYA